MLFILITKEVSNEDKSIFFKDVQPWNKNDISVTLFAPNELSPFIFMSEEHPKNKYDKLFILLKSNFDKSTSIKLAQFLNTDSKEFKLFFNFILILCIPVFLNLNLSTTGFISSSLIVIDSIEFIMFTTVVSNNLTLI